MSNFGLLDPNHANSGIDTQTGLKVLLVEDDEDDYLLTLELFDRAYGDQYSLTWENNPARVINRLNDDNYDVCLVDYQLGSTTGVELIKLMLSEDHEDMAIILLTGLDNHEVDLLATEAGATDYLIKHQLKPELLERSIRYSIRQKRTEAEVRHMAFHDPLTGLANRALFSRYLERSINVCRRHKEYSALLFIDLDNFKSVNDSLGHSIGDDLLVEITIRLKTNIRHEDIIARLGGDEFVLLFNRLSSDKSEAFEQAGRFAEKIRRELNSPINIANDEFRIGCSIGVTLFSEENVNTEILLKHADIAMYRAKSDGKNRVRFFETEMEESVKSNYWVEQELHNALEKSQFELFYQPIFSLEDNIICGAEALIRWHHPDRGLILPDDFIPIAEKSDLICAIGSFVISEACAFLKQTPALDYLSINIGTRHFESNNFSNELDAALSLTGIEPERLVIELTEHVFLKNESVACRKMTSLRDKGLRFALDDFGTGYSSLSALKNLPFNILKIDRSFINDIGFDVSSDAIIQAIIVMSKSMDLSVIAEGVENLNQKQFLTDFGCATAQGYQLSKPLTSLELTQMLAS